MISAVNIPSPAGSLEGLLEIPAAYDGEWAAVICHPHPLYGGTMRHKVPDRMAAALRTCGAAVLRFNFRGVGRSTGEHDGGAGEEEDLGAAWTFIRQRTNATRLILGGFSFGAWVALKTAERLSGLQYLLAAGCPVELYDFSFIRRIRIPLLLVQGDRDDYGCPAGMRTLVRLADGRASLVIIEGADHTFTRRLTRLTRAIVEYFRPRLESWAPQDGAASRQTLQD
jgi:alpha/beta superfamily hydrolase